MKKLIDILGALLVVGGIIYLNKDDLTTNSNEKCCTACSGGNQKYINPSGDKCGEVCLGQFIYWISKPFYPNLVLANKTTCSSLGYTLYKGTTGGGLNPLSIEVDKYSKPES